MKKQIFGTIMCLLGFVLVSGGTIVNGLLAIVCLSAGVYALRKESKPKSKLKIYQHYDREKLQAA